ncbi:hypothetical protein BGZ68_005954 [Mortierella alpina]|nr:hypothetical protein BGZ68_005954 [Mortierella alpina]
MRTCTSRSWIRGGEAGSALTYEGSTNKGISKLEPEHEKRIKGLKLKEDAEDVAKTAGTAAALGAAGAAVFGLVSGDKKKEEAEKRDAALGQH